MKMDNLNFDKNEYNEIKDAVTLYWENVCKYPLLTREEEVELVKKMNSGDKEAKNKLINSNLRLVVKIARHYFVKDGMPFLDLIQEGNIGLITAIEKFDVEKGYKLSSYATWWISFNIERAIANKSRTVRIPVKMYDKIRNYNKAYNKLYQLKGDKPSIEELSKELNISYEKTSLICNSLHDTISLNEIIFTKEDFSYELGDSIQDSSESIEEIIINRQFKQSLIKLFKQSNLTQRELEVLILRFGLDGKEPRTLKKVGEILSFSKQAIHQIESKALTKIRNYKYITEFTIYMDNQKQSIENIIKYREAYQKKLNKNKK